MQDKILIVDCYDEQHIVHVDDILTFDTLRGFNKPPITIVRLKEIAFDNVHKDFKTYESENSIRLRYSKIYDALHKEG